jgi:hypothetical protein
LGGIHVKAERRRHTRAVFGVRKLNLVSDQALSLPVVVAKVEVHAIGIE